MDPDDEDTLASNWWRNAPQNPDLEVTLPEPFNAPPARFMVKFVSIPESGLALFDVADTIAIAPFRSVHLFDLYDQFAGIECDDELKPWASDLDNRLWEAGVDVFEYFTVLDSPDFPAVGTIGAPGSAHSSSGGAAKKTSPIHGGLATSIPSWSSSRKHLGGMITSGRILHDDLGNRLAWNISLGSAVKLV